MAPSHRLKVLFIAGWRTDFGDFIAEHHRAVSTTHDVYYVHVEFKKKFSLLPFFRIGVRQVDNDPRQVVVTVSCYLRRLGMFDFVVNKALVRILRRWGVTFDLVHVNVRTPETEALVSNALLRSIPKVLTEHNTFYHTKINNQFPDPSLRAAEKERISRWLAKSDFTYVIPVSRQLGDVLVERFGAPRERIRVVPNVAATQYLLPPDPHVRTDGPVRLLLVAFWTYPKNLLLFGRALTQLHPGLIARLHVDLVGDGELVPEFLQFAKKHLPDLQLTWHGFLNDNAMLASMYRKADFLVHPTDAENLPCVIIESLCCGTPVLSNDVNGIGELVENGVNGLLCPRGDMDGMAGILASIAERRVHFDRHAIHRRAVQRFAPDQVGASLSKIYGEAVALGNTTGEQRPYQQCTQCVLDTHDDGSIQFDERGICTYCNRYKRLEGTRLFLGKDRERELRAVVARIKAARKHPKYDCIAGVSGGVDSSYVALKMKQLGLTPLLVHLDNGWNTDISWQNIRGIVDHLGFDLHTFAPDAAEFRDIQLAFLRASVMDIEMPTDHAVVAYIYNLANKLGIQYIISGDNFATEGVLPNGWSHDKKDLLNIRTITRQFSGRRIRSLPTLGYFRRHYLVLFKGIKVVPLLNYMPYDKQLAKEEITKVLAWTDYGAKHGESIFTRFYQNHILPTKFNVDKRKAHLSALICSGQMDRATALSELDQPAYPPELFSSDMELVTAKLGLTAQDLATLMSAKVNRHTDFPSYTTRHYRREEALRGWLRPVIQFIKKNTGLRHESNYV